jgi:hypothetical protein
MNPILVQQMAQYRMDSLDREAAAVRRVSLAKAAAAQSVPMRQRINRTAGHLRLIIRGAAA